jgi:hypothetical protein
MWHGFDDAACNKDITHKSLIKIKLNKKEISDRLKSKGGNILTWRNRNLSSFKPCINISQNTIEVEQQH